MYNRRQKTGLPCPQKEILKMISKAQILLMIILAVTVCCRLADGQGVSSTILTVDVENLVSYFEDTSDLSTFATIPSVTTPALPKNFHFRVSIADIVAINGQAVKGTLTRNIRTLMISPTPNAGQGIADTTRNAIASDSFEILNSDGTPIGTIVSYGPAAGPPP